MSLQRITSRPGPVFLRSGEEGQNPPMAVDDHRHLTVQLAVTQAAFDLFRLDPKTANLHLIVAPSAQFDAFARPLRHIAGAIGTQVLPIGQCQVQIAFGGLLRVVQITQAHAGTCDV
ncbi:hypothetical protein D3C85_909800 [compost metagenome]